MLTVEKGEASGSSKYQMLNAMLELQEQGRQEELEARIKEYLEKEHQASVLFPLMD